jgi:arylsulfatase A-like enzyme
MKQIKILDYEESFRDNSKEFRMPYKPSRREFLKILGLGAASLLSSQQSIVRRDAKKHNVLFLFTDDQRFDTMRALGNENISTPHMDALVKRGTSFRNAYIMGGNSGAVCMPSRAMLLTGRGLYHIEGQGESIPETHVMLPELFRKDGYTTFGTGKWHNGREAFARCFADAAEIMFGGMSDHWNVPAYHFDATGAYETKTPVIEDPLHSNRVTLKGYDHIAEGKHSSELFAEAAIDFLEKHDSSNPFFLYVAFTAPHDPRSMPEEFLQMYDPQKIPLPENFMPQHPFDNGEMEVRDEQLAGFPRTPEEVHRHLVEYYAMISHLDAQIGRILEALKKTGQADNTLVIFTGDNGLAVGQHGLMGKQSVYEHSVHVPLVMSGPNIPRGESRDAFCYLMDIFPTVCELTGRPIPNSVQGKSLNPVIRKENERVRHAVYFAYKNCQRALRIGRWKLILYNVKGEKHVQLFDLEEDPWEMNNLADESSPAGRIRELTEILRSLMKQADDPVQLDEPDWGVKENL